MSESSSIDYVTARKSHTLVLKRLQSFGQKPLAEMLDKSEPWVTGWKSTTLQQTCEALAALGLKIVPATHKCFPDEHIRSLTYFARIGMKTESLGLDWSDPE